MQRAFAVELKGWAEVYGIFKISVWNAAYYFGNDPNFQNNLGIEEAS